MSILLDDVKAYFASKYLDGVHYIRINYDGAGDSGDVNEIEFFDSSFDYIDNAQDKEYQKLCDIFSNHFDDQIGDWYNNDGGYGYVEIDLKKGTYDIYANYRTVEESHIDGSILDFKD
jgi:hypothetical protein